VLTTEINDRLWKRHGRYLEPPVIFSTPGSD